MGDPRFAPLDQSYYWVGWYTEDYFCTGHHENFHTKKEVLSRFDELVKLGCPEVFAYRVPAYSYDDEAETIKEFYAEHAVK